MISNQKKDAAAKPHQCWFRWASLSSHSWGSTVKPDPWSDLLNALPQHSIPNEKCMLTSCASVIRKGSSSWFSTLWSFLVREAMGGSFLYLSPNSSGTGLWMEGKWRKWKLDWPRVQLVVRTAPWRCQVKKLDLLHDDKVFFNVFCSLNTHRSNGFVV